MDCDVEIIIPDSSDENDEPEIIIPDSSEVHDEPNVNDFSFSQVQIEVHDPEIAEQLVKNTVSIETLEYEETEYLDQDFEDDGIQEINSDSDEDAVETVSDNTDHNIITDQRLDAVVSQEELINVIENHISKSPNTNSLNTALTDYIHESDMLEELEGVERIPDDELSKYDAIIVNPHHDNNVVIKEEIEPFLGTDYTNFDAGSYIHYKEEDLPPEDIYHCNSKIILGTKPCSSREKLQLEEESASEIDINEENLNAFVLLEDWAHNLKKSKCFCKDCGRLFATPNSLMDHNNSEHSFLVPINKNVAYKSTSKSAYARKSTGATIAKIQKNCAKKSTENKISQICHHCNKVFANIGMLNKHLYDVFFKRFACDVCDAAFSSQKDLISHNAVHIKVKKEKVEEDTALKKQLVYEEDSKKRRSVSSQNKFELVPRSVLFQCPKCDVNSIAAFSGFAHFLLCNPNNEHRNNYRYVTCPICKKTFKTTNLKAHLKQHKVSSKFKVYKMSKATLERTLCKCPKCFIHFTDYGLQTHINSCGTVPSKRCVKCNILLPNSRHYHKHMSLHQQEHLKPKDFIIVQHAIYVRGKNTNLVKRKQEPIEMPAKKIKLDFSKVKKEPNIKFPVEKKYKMIVAKRKFETKGDKVRLYYCKHCGCSVLSRRNIKFHLTKSCTKVCQNKTTICSDCGLKFTCKTILNHSNMHKFRSLSIHDMEFCDMETLKRVTPKMPKYPKCTNCKITFFRKKMHHRHICGEDYETCDVCNEKFHKDNIEVHTEFHEFLNARCPKAKIAKESKIMPEIIKKYESLNMMWNIVFCCLICDVVTDEYDKAVEHSQGHQNNDAATKNIKCYICNLKFDDTCWSRHSMLHSQMTINSKDFNILHYNPNKLFTNDWFELFSSLPEDQITQITNKSLYSDKRRFKLKLLKEGRSEFTLYCCSDCKVCVRDNEIEKHINGSCKNCGNICKICCVPFSDISTLKNHQMRHMAGIKKDEFRIVMFTKSQDKAGDSKRNNYNTEKIKINPHPILHNKEIVNKIKSNRTNVTYKCPKKGDKNLKRSNVKQKSKIQTVKGKIEARNLKENNMKSSWKILPDEEGKFVVLKCTKCGVCSHRYKVLLKHDCNEPQFSCLHCNNLYALKGKKYHYNIHRQKSGFRKENLKLVPFNRESDDDVTGKKVKKKTVKTYTPKPTKVQNKRINSEKFNIPEEKPTTSNTAVVYKCECGLHYTSLQNIEKHAPNCPDSEISKENCSKCGLLFPTDVLVSHLCKHHSKNSNFTVKLYEDAASTSKYPTLNVSRRTPINNSVSTSKSPMLNVAKKTSNTKYEVHPKEDSRAVQNKIESASKSAQNNENDKNSRSNSNTSQNETESTYLETSRTTKSHSNCKVKLYKCSECNVHYVSQGTCYGHVRNHQPINSIKCIDCKLCGLQFTVTTLPAHISRHHKKNFDLSNVLIEEYKPRVGKAPPEIEIYIAADRVQSLQVTSSMEES